MQHPTTNPESLQADQTPAEKFWFCVRRNGEARHSGWIGKISSYDLLQDVEARPGDVVETCICGNFRLVSPERFRKVFYPRALGLTGMEITFRGETVRYAPSWMLATNLRFKRALDRFLEDRGISTGEFADEGSLRAFSARQFLLPADGKDKKVALYRGATLVAPEPAPRENRAAELADGIGRWMLRNLSPDGALPYKYWPSRGEESPADNAIRRFLATLSLARLAELRRNGELKQAAVLNLRYNLKRYFQDIGNGRGAIVENTGAKLGAAALAALAILESPARGEFQTELTMLATGVDSLFDKEQGFRTFFFPPERDGENWNFYSGEALLFWAEARRRNAGFAPSLERCTEVFSRCRERHFRARNPAFVPWHTQACVSFFQQTGRREFADFVFEINDWLLPMQQWDGLLPDLRGRFYNPKRPDYGPPHAASTGAYLEGLADALALARALGDSARTSAYELAVQRGLRSLRQLQFRDRHDTFYISKKPRVLGALRTEVYDNAVRVDSAAHALAAAIKILRPEKF
ncbi:MAG: hypothetical protein OXM59_10150 [Gammaproteobacteria bacterium]|nr:hypothetical protein [Gammaproteobacteria bacterium]